MIGTPTSTPPPSLPKSNLPVLYYGLVIVATAAIVLMLYNLVVLRWCTDQPGHRTPGSSRRRQGPTPASRINTYSFKYKRESGDSECAVCLSVFEEGEEIRQLPQCNHYFHAPCIDMWLYSHMDCPLCRSPVDPPEHSRQELLGV